MFIAGGRIHTLDRKEYAPERVVNILFFQKIQLFLIKQFALKLSCLDLGPKASFDPAELAGGVESEWGLGGDTRQEGEVAPGGEHGHLSLQQGKPHPNASTGTLAEGLECIPEDGKWSRQKFDTKSLTDAVWPSLPC